jgi:hypothetical protein
MIVFALEIKSNHVWRPRRQAIEVVLLSIFEMHTEMHTVSSRRWANAQTRSSLISLTVKVAIGAPELMSFVV